MSNYQKGKTVTGTVTGIEKYGIFVSLDNYYSGLIHISEISNGFVKDIEKIANIGETISAKILEVDDNTCHLKLSIKDMNYKSVKKERQKIVEVGNGFKPLEEKLEGWIESKFNEIEKK